MTLRNHMLAILLSGWIRTRPLVDTVMRDRTSAAGNSAGRTVRQLSMLLGNAATQELRTLGFGPLLTLLASPAWLESHVSTLARQRAFEVKPDQRAAWAEPIGISGGNDSTLRGVPGGAAGRVVALYLAEGIGVHYASPEVRNGVAWRGLAQASTAFERPARPIVGALEVLSDTGPRDVSRASGEAAVRREFAAELAWLSTPDGQRAIAGLEAPMVAIEAPDPGVSAAIEAIDRAAEARQIGRITPIQAPGRVQLLPRFVPILQVEPDLVSDPGPDLSDQLGANRTEGEAPDAADAPVEEAPAKTTKKKRSGLWTGLGLTAAGATLLAWLKGR